MIDFAEYSNSATYAATSSIETSDINLIPRVPWRLKGSTVSKHSHFHDTVVDRLLHPSAENKQIILTGMPSAGKSTELKRIAKLLAEKTASTNHVVHLCLIQNDFSPGSGIFNIDDLWNAILRCHSAASVRATKQSLTEFCKLHANNGSKPILLIDTLDILPYGMDMALHDNLLQIWRQLVGRLREAAIQVIWTCRTMESRLFESVYVESKPIPRLDGASVLSLVSRTQHVQYESDKENHQYVAASILSIHAFPILSRFFGENPVSFYIPVGEFFSTFFGTHLNKMRLAPPPSHPNPILWAMDIQSQTLPIDIMYDVLKKQAISFLKDDGFEPFDGLSLEQHWSQIVEENFFRIAVFNPSAYGSRLLIERFNSDDSPPLKALKSQIFYLGEKLGLFHLHSKKVAFSHQLFAENCLFKGVSKHKLTEDDVQKFVGRFPSLKIKFLSKFKNLEVDNEWQTEYQKWISSYVVACDLTKFERLTGSGWEAAVWLSRKAHKYQEEVLNLEWIGKDRPTSQQDEILQNLPPTPLFLNGPAGTGKTHMAPWFIHKKLYDDSQNRVEHDLDYEYKINFFTMSPYLAEDFELKWTKYADGIEDFQSRLNAQSIDDLMFELNRVIYGSYLSNRAFKESLLLEPKFIRLFKSSKDAAKDPLLNRYSPHGLWNEYVTNFVSSGGRPAETLEQFKSQLSHSINKRGSGGKRSEPNSIFYQFNDEGSPRIKKDIESFYRILSNSNLALHGPNPRFKTRQQMATTLSKRIKEIQQSGTVEQREKLLNFMSDVSIFDEIQDLQPTIVELLLLLHSGPVDMLMGMGDDDQTLDYEKFDWNDFLLSLLSIVKDWEKSNSEVMRKWSECRFSSIEIQYLEEVERSVPKIVEFVKDAYLSSVSREYSTITSEDSGTVSTRPGIYSMDRLRKYESLFDKRQIGVSVVHESLSRESLASLMSTIYRSTNQAMVIFPSFHQYDKWVLEFEEQYQLPTWHPLSVKGLESELVIALAPWSVDRKLLEAVLAQFDKHRSIDWTGLEKVVNSRGKNNSYQSRFRNIVSQRKRHGNVMVSRAKRHLVIVPLDDIDFDLAKAKDPDFLVNSTAVGSILNYYDESEIVPSISLDDLIEIINTSSQQTHDGRTNPEQKWFDALEDLLSFMIHLMRTDSENMLLRNISLAASHIISVAPANKYTQDVMPTLWAIEKTRKSEEIRTEVENLGFQISDDQNDSMDVFIPLTALVDKKIKMASIEKNIENFRELAKSAEVLYDIDSISIPISVWIEAEEQFEALCEALSEFKLAGSEDSGIDIKSVQDWVRTRFEPLEQTSTDAEKWLRKLKKYNNSTGTFIFDRQQAPNLSNPVGLLGLFWPKENKRENLKSKLDEIDKELRRANAVAKKGDKELEDVISDLRKDLNKQRSKIESQLSSIKDEVAPLGNHELFQASQFDSKDSREATERFWKNGIGLLMKFYPNTGEATVSATWEEQQSNLLGSDISYVDQLNVMLYLSTSILHNNENELNHVEFINALLDLDKTSKVGSASSIDAMKFLQNKWIDAKKIKQIRLNIISRCLNGEGEAIDLVQNQNIDLKELFATLSGHFKPNPVGMYRFVKFASIHLTPKVTKQLEIYVHKSNQHFMDIDAVSQFCEVQKEQLRGVKISLDELLVGDHYASQFRSEEDLNSFLEELKNSDAFGDILIYILCRINEYLHLHKTMRLKSKIDEGFEKLDRINKEFNLDQLIEKHLSIEKLNASILGVNETLEEDTMDYILLFNQTSLSQKDARTFVLFTEIAKRWNIGEKKKGFMEIENQIEPLHARMLTSARNMRESINKNGKDFSKTNYDDFTTWKKAGFIDKAGIVIEKLPTFSTEKNYFTDSEVGKIVARNMSGQPTSNSAANGKRTSEEKYEHITEFLRQAILTLESDDKDRFALIDNVYHLRLGRHYTAPRITLRDFIGITDYLAYLRTKVDVLQGVENIDDVYSAFDSVFTLQNLIEKLVKRLRANKQATTVNAGKHFINTIDDLYRDLEKHIKAPKSGIRVVNSALAARSKLPEQVAESKESAKIACIRIARQIYEFGPEFNDWNRSEHNGQWLGGRSRDKIFINGNSQDLTKENRYASLVEFLGGKLYQDARTSKWLVDNFDQLY